MIPWTTCPMILIIDNKELDYSFNFNQRSGDRVQDLIDLFVRKKGEELFDKAELVAVTHGDFFYVIKNIYGNLIEGIILSDIQNLVKNHIAI